MTRALLAALLAAVALPASAETFAIAGGTVALGDGSQPIPNGVVVVRDMRSRTAVEQILGRVLRMPQATRKQQSELNHACAVK